MTYSIRRFFLIGVASLALFSSCSSKKTQETEESGWKNLYKTASANHDYSTAIVALNQLIFNEKDSTIEYFDTLAYYYLRKTANYKAAQTIAEKGLTLNSNNLNLLEIKALILANDGKTQESLSILDKLLAKSPRPRYKYYRSAAEMSMSPNDDGIKNYMNSLDAILKECENNPETVERETRYSGVQKIDLRGQIYYEKATYAWEMQDIKNFQKYLDSSMIISPEYENAKALKAEFLKYYNNK